LLQHMATAESEPCKSRPPTTTSDHIS
jgi:hypothetical protein